MKFLTALAAACTALSGWTAFNNHRKWTFALIGIAIAAILLDVAFYLIEQRRRLNDFVKVPRADVQLGTSTIRFLADNRVDVTIRLINRGTLTANRIRLFGGILVRSISKNPIDRQQAESTAAAKYPSTLSAGSSTDFLLQLKVSNEFGMMSIKRGLVQLFVVGSCEYDDEASQTHTLKLCLQYAPGYDRLHFANAIYCPEGNVDR